MTTHRNFSNIAVETNLAVGINATQTDLDVVSDTGWPAVPFTMRIEEELILVTVRTGTDFSTIIREYDGTTGVAHTTTPPVTHVVAAIDVGQAHTLVDDEGDSRIVIGANGDITWNTDGGASAFMLWDESDDRIEIFRDLFFSSNNLIAVGQFSFNNGPDSGDAWEFLLRNAGDSIVISQFDSGIGEVDRLEIIGAGTAVTNEGDIIFYDLAGVELLRFDDSDDQWEFVKGMTVAGNVDARTATMFANVYGSFGTDLFIRADDTASAQDIFLQAADSTGSLKQRINILGGLGDIEFYKLDGGTVSLMWDNSDDQWEFAADIDMGSNFINNVDEIHSLETFFFIVADNGDLYLRADKTTAAAANILLQTADSGGTLRTRINIDGDDDITIFKVNGATPWVIFDEGTGIINFNTPILVTGKKIDEVYADNAKTGLNVASVTDVTAVTTDVEGIVAGDVIIVRIWGRLLNNSGANRVYTFTPDFDSVFDPELGSTIVVHATDLRPIMFEWSLAVASASDARLNGRSIMHSSGIPGTWDAITVDYIVADATTSDLTGTVTVSFKIRSASATATQTWFTDGFVVRKIGST